MGINSPSRSPEARKEYMRKWHEKNPGKSKEYQQAYYRKHKEAHNAYGREYYKNNKEACARLSRKSQLKSYGTTPEAVDQMLLDQGGACAICGKVTKLHVDHNRETRAVRELLCLLCNTAIGKFQHDPKLLEKAAAYMRKWTNE